MKLEMHYEYRCGGMTVAEAKGRGTEGHTQLYRGAEYNIDFLPKIVLDIVEDDLYEKACEVISRITLVK